MINLPKVTGVWRECRTRYGDRYAGRPVPARSRACAAGTRATPAARAPCADQARAADARERVQSESHVATALASPITSKIALPLVFAIALATAALATAVPCTRAQAAAPVAPANPVAVKAAPSSANNPAPSAGANGNARFDTVALEMFVGETRVLPGIDAVRVAVGNGRVLAASALDQHELLLIANDAGTTTVHIWCRDGRRQRMNVHVRPSDMARTTREILDFLSDLPNVRARAVGDKVLIEGDHLTDEQQFKIDELARRYPQIVNFTARVGWEQMILIDIKVVEFTKQRLRDLGVRWDAGTAGPNAGVAGDVARNGAFVVSPVSGGINTVDARRQAIDPFRWYFGIVAALSSRLNIYERNGDAVVLAAPQLTARSGSTARFQAGGEIPYSVVSQSGFVSVQFRSFGIIIEVKPRADASGAIRSEIVAEVSEPDASISSLQGVPALRTRKTQTEFNVRAGETMVLSGLLDRRKGESIEKVPGLGDLPILGALFRSKRFENNESELVIFVTPRIVTADSATLERTRRNLENASDRYLNGAEEGNDVGPGGEVPQRPGSTSPSPAPSTALLSSPRPPPAAPQLSTDAMPRTARSAATATTSANEVATAGATTKPVPGAVANSASSVAASAAFVATAIALTHALPPAPQSVFYAPSDGRRDADVAEKQAAPPISPALIRLN